MTRKDQQERYLDFLNEAVGLMQVMKVDNLSEVAEKYGVGKMFISFLRSTNILIPQSKSRRYPDYTTSHPEQFTANEMSMLISKYREWKLGKKESSVNVFTHEKEGDVLTISLTAFTTRQLLAELKRRGYSGTLTIKKEIQL